MSSAVEVVTAKPVASNLPWGLWGRQVRAILRMEVKKNFWGKRAILIYLFAAIPVLLMFLLIFADENAAGDITRNWGSAQEVFANIFEALILRTMVFFGCAWIFMNLFRGEVVDKSLHYYFLSALRREVLVAGKYFSGLLTSVILFSLTTIGSLFFLYWAREYPANINFLFDGPGLGQCLTYLGATILGCIGYGAVFMFIGLYFRNPIIPALVVYGWEWANFLLPPVLKKISIIHYLHTLAPIPMNEGPFATVVTATSPWISVPSLLVFTILVLALAARRIRKMEIRYGGE
jgi:ABC-type transport system involved in multi-copper enzyme maturation permease subunit